MTATVIIGASAELVMTDNAWRVRSEFFVNDEFAGDSIIEEELANVARELNLQPMLVEQLMRTLSGVARSVHQRNRGDLPCPSVLVRILVSGAEGLNRRSHQGWGFFLVTKTEEPTAQCRVDVFLYPEG